MGHEYYFFESAHLPLKWLKKSTGIFLTNVICRLRVYNKLQTHTVL